MKTIKFFVVTMMCVLTVEAQTVYHVKTDGNDADAGTSWGTAFATVQAALSAAISGDQIWVAAGTYKPTSTSDRSISFNLKNGVAIYGGFAGTEGALGERDWNVNMTILSGDIDGDLTLSGNSYHVVKASSIASTAILDGFNIIGGNADAGGNDMGGGIYLLFSSPILTHLSVIGNNASSSGGGLTNIFGNPILTDIMFSDNISATSGGGMRNDFNSNPQLTNVSFIGNSSADGAGMYNTATSNPVLTNVTFTNNIASSEGGGLYNDGSAPVLNNVLFLRNKAFLGGGVFDFDGTASFTNVTFSKDSARFGGGMFITGTAGHSWSIKNTILWGNLAFSNGPQIHNTSNAMVTVSYSLIDGGISGTGIGGNALTDGGNNISGDPLFVDAENDDLSLMQASPAVDVGNNAVVTAATDLGGDPRITNTTVDMGAYEYQGPPLPVELVSFTASTNGKGAELKWTTATELNNYGFEIQRSVISSQLSVTDSRMLNTENSTWTKIGFVEGNGTSNAPKEYSFTDKNLKVGKYSYRLKQIDRDGKFEYSNEIKIEVGTVPKVFALEQNYPNPFNPVTKIGFTIPASGVTTLKVYDMLGKEVKTLVNEIKEAGEYSVEFNGEELSSGIYFYVLQANGTTQTRKLMLLK